MVVQQTLEIIKNTSRSVDHLVMTTSTEAIVYLNMHIIRLEMEKPLVLNFRKLLVGVPRAHLDEL